MSKFEIPSVGVGTARTPAAWIIIMLASEDDWMRPQIILKVMEHLGISIDALVECYNKYKSATQPALHLTRAGSGEKTDELQPPAQVS